MQVVSFFPPYSFYIGIYVHINTLCLLTQGDSGAFAGCEPARN